MKYSILLLLSSFLFLSCVKQECTLSSPDGSLHVKVLFDKENKLTYNVTSDNQTVIEDSPLGLILDKIVMDKDLVMTNSRISDIITEEFNMLTGKQTHVKETYKEAVLTFENGTKDNLQIIVRAYNTGIAFRYKMELNDTTYTVEQELSGFKLPEGKAWLLPYDDPDGYSPAYEAPYQNDLDVNAQSYTKAGWAFPALFSVKDRWILISESDEDGNYCSVHLSFLSIVYILRNYLSKVTRMECSLPNPR